MPLVEKTSIKPNPNDLSRFYSYIFYDFNGCWRWTLKLDKDGYGAFWVKKQNYRAHRYAYLTHVGEIPEGLELDHLCRVRDCVNPKHLTPKTTKDNILCGEGLAAVNARKTHCNKGHAFTNENTYNYLEKRNGKTYPTRHCRTCLKITQEALNKTNIRGIGQYSKAKTHCKQGHPFSQENTYHYKNKSGNDSRGCKICRRKFTQKHRQG